MEVYVDELISSSLVIVRGGRKQRCQIHELVHEFCSIKARTDKLFDLTSSIFLSSFSSSDLMLRSRTIIIDEDSHSHDSSLFSPEKRNPYVKHLLSLQHDYQWRILRFPNNGHLRHLRLLKRLELPCVMVIDTLLDEIGMLVHLRCLSIQTKVIDTLLDEIGMLVHLRCLSIQTKAEALPPSFSNLCNLETLEVEDSGSNLLENLLSLKRLKLSSSVDSEDIFKWFPNLQSLKFFMFCWREEQIYFPRLDVLNKP
ncbi:hypothetical protein P3S68_024856 [Capsicum galapagoense]